ncbi:MULTISPECIES: hypothetical protein [unclassified Streptomyces]|uniref:hypothetical protein n=1 Tax=unclassified Streptomyces TaxID=2593676 RepID=UPI00364FE626
MQAASTALRLVMAIADAVRRQQEQQGVERALPSVEDSPEKTGEESKRLLPPDIATALMQGADWPRMAQQLMALKDAGVDLEGFLPRVGEIAVSVRDQVAENQARVARDGTGEWEKLLRETLPAGPVREAILSSPTWPDIAATMGRLKESGVDVQGVLTAAHEEGLGVDQAVAKVLGAAEPGTSRDALMAYGPLTTGLDLPRDLDLSDRQRALRQLAISPQENERFMRMMREALPGRENEANLLLTAKKWPLLAARMAMMEGEDIDLEPHLEQLTKNTTWEKGSPTGLSSRLLGAAHQALQEPPDALPDSAERVSTKAAKTQSGGGPTKARASKGATPTAPAVAAHRTAGPAVKPSRAK